MTNALTWLLAIPAVGALLMLLIPPSWEATIRRTSVGIAVLEFLLSLRLLAADYSTPGYRFVEEVPWIESFGISYKLGVDGLSLWLVLLTTLLTPIALYASWSSAAPSP